MFIIIKLIFKQKCKNNNKLIGKKLEIFTKNLALLQDYNNNPDKELFEKVNLELISYCF